MYLDHLILLLLVATVVVVIGIGGLIGFLYCSFNPNQGNDDESDD